MNRCLKIAVCLSLVLIILGNTVLNVALPTLAKDLHASGSDLQWIVDSYVLVFAGLLLTTGSLSDRFGRKRVRRPAGQQCAAGGARRVYRELQRVGMSRRDSGTLLHQ